MTTRVVLPARLGMSVALAATVSFSARALASPPYTDVARKEASAARPIDRTLGTAATRAVVPASLYAALAVYVPSFSRQTGLACSACHYQFPQLTPFGRMFKLNGYTLTSLPTIGQPGDSAGHESLKLPAIPPVAAMMVAGLTNVARAEPGTQNETVGFPQELSLFLAGAITPHIGTFTQLTYSGVDGSIGIDNWDLRWARHLNLADQDLLFGVTLHNNPTVQDVWNTVPAWGFPFMASEIAPAPAAGTLIDGGLGQAVFGFGAYALWDNTVYAEASGYRSAPQGAVQPLDTSATNTIKGVIPYWRLALQHAWATTYGMIGTYGFGAHLYPTGVAGPTNDYTDAAVDAQLEHKSGIGMWIARATYIHEQQKLSAFASEVPAAAANLRENLSTIRANVSLEPSLRYSLSGGYFQTTGTTDPILFAPAPLTGSRTGSPNTRGGIGEITMNPWQNTRFALQYVFYSMFNGGSANYDAAARRASDNNTLFLYLWFAL
jgi:hypothetical protein